VASFILTVQLEIRIQKQMDDLIPSNENELVISSYNCRGLRDDKLVYILEMLHKTDILFIQEHLLSDEQLSHFQSVVSHSHVDIHGVVVSAHRKFSVVARSADALYYGVAN
jgi:hypothetical protein